MKDLFLNYAVIVLLKGFLDSRKQWVLLNDQGSSLFTIVNYLNATAKQLCVDLDKITEWAFEWKMSFNPDPSKRKKLFLLVRSKSL